MMMEMKEMVEERKMACKIICNILKANNLRIQDIDRYIHEEIAGIEYES